MIKHIVMFKLKEEKAGRVKELKEKLDSLRGKIKEIENFETGINISTSFSAYDLVLISEFKTMEDLEKYRVHPDHQEVLEFWNTIKDGATVVDYEMQEF